MTLTAVPSRAAVLAQAAQGKSQRLLAHRKDWYSRRDEQMASACRASTDSFASAPTPRFLLPRIIMSLEVIYVVRHAHRLHWTVDPVSGRYTSNTPTPTGIPADVQLASYGVGQAKELAEKVATLDPPPDFVYSSPWYRCLQTIEPSVQKLRAEGKANVEVRVENGIGEFFGKALFEHPAPADAADLSNHFTFVDKFYQPVIRASRQGETLDALHDRNAYALHRMIKALDEDPRHPRAALLCTHAAGMICIGRALTGDMPQDATTDDFKCGTCAMSRFERRSTSMADDGNDLWDLTEPDAIPALNWRDGKGVGGAWECVVNGDCSFLKGGEERTWRFSGDESFIIDASSFGQGKL